MTVAMTTMSESVRFLAAAMQGDDRSEWDVGLHEVLEMVVDLISDGDADGISAAYEEIEQLHATTASSTGIHVDVPGQLRLLSMLMSLAAVRPDRSQLQQLAQRECNILWALEDAQDALDNRELSARTNHAEAVVSRALRQLRAAGLVTTSQQWRRKLSKLTEKGRQMASGLPRQSVAREEISLLLARLSRADAGPADVWAMAHRIGVDVLSTGATTEEQDAVELGSNGKKWCIRVTGRSERQMRVLIARGLGQLAALSEFPAGELKLSRDEATVPASSYMRQLYSGGSREAVYADACSAAVLMPELPMTRSFLELGDTRAVAVKFDVPEDAVRRRLSALGLYPSFSGIPTDDPQPGQPVTEQSSIN